MSTVTPPRVTECTDTLMSSQKGLEEHNAVRGVVLKSKHETNCETLVAYSVGLHSCVLNHLYSVIKYIVLFLNNPCGFKL